jgi:hypothetical protein
VDIVCCGALAANKKVIMLPLPSDQIATTDVSYAYINIYLSVTVANRLSSFDPDGIVKSSLTSFVILLWLVNISGSVHL